MAAHDKMVAQSQEKYKENRHKILQAQEEMIEESGKNPTMKAIAERCGLSTDTVYNHFREIKIKDEVLPKYNKYVTEILNRHLELARQNDDKKVALQAILTLEEKLFDMIQKKQIDHTDIQTKKLVIEVTDDRKKLEFKEAELVEIKPEEDKCDTSTN